MPRITAKMISGATGTRYRALGFGQFKQSAMQYAPTASQTHCLRPAPCTMPMISRTNTGQPNAESIQLIAFPPAVRNRISGHRNQENHLPQLRIRSRYSCAKLFFADALAVIRSSVLDSAVGGGCGSSKVAPASF